MTEKSKSKRRLQPPTLEDRIRRTNLIGGYAVLEALEGPTSGLGRLIYRLFTEVHYLGDERVEMVSVATDGIMRSYRLDEDTMLAFVDDQDIATFSSGGIQYRIRPVEESDSDWIIGFDWSVLKGSD
jgi:hypothetical protein